MWAHRYQNWNNEHCSNLVFADTLVSPAIKLIVMPQVCQRVGKRLVDCCLQETGWISSPLMVLDNFHAAGTSKLVVLDGTIKQQHYINNLRPWTRQTIQRNLVWPWERHALYCMEKVCLWGWCHAVNCGQPWSQTHRVCLAPDGAVHQRHR